MDWWIALLLKPLAFFVLLVIVAAMKIGLDRYLPDSPMKRFLFKERDWRRARIPPRRL